LYRLLPSAEAPALADSICPSTADAVKVSTRLRAIYVDGNEAYEAVHSCNIVAVGLCGPRPCHIE